MHCDIFKHIYVGGVNNSLFINIFFPNLHYSIDNLRGKSENNVRNTNDAKQILMDFKTGQFSFSQVFFIYFLEGDDSFCKIDPPA